MATPVSQRELRNDSGAIMRRVQQGERFTVTRYGVPVADLVSHRESGPDRPPRFIPVAQIAAGTSEPPSWDTARFTHELEELDNAVDDSHADRCGELGLQVSPVCHRPKTRCACSTTPRHPLPS